MSQSGRGAQRHQPIYVIPFPREWASIRGVSVATALRLAKAGKVKVTHMSERKRGVRSDHDQEYLDSCLRDSA
jgi:predicted site-specific integrase-resolvase